MRYIISGGDIIDDDLNKILLNPSFLMSAMTLIEVGELTELRRILHKI